MAFGVGHEEDEEGFSNWFPDDPKNHIEELLDKLLKEKLFSKPKYAYFIDMGMEFSIYDINTKEIIYEGSVNSFIEDLMENMNVQDDN